jgi:hypothetical protein
MKTFTTLGNAVSDILKSAPRVNYASNTQIAKWSTIDLAKITFPDLDINLLDNLDLPGLSNDADIIVDADDDSDVEELDLPARAPRMSWEKNY